MARPVESSKPCFKCGRKVVKCESKSGKIYVASIEIVSSQYADYSARGKAIYPVHECDESEIAKYQVKIARELAEGAIVKGQKVVVVKGRKVAKGTEGEIFWLGYETWNGESILTRVGIVTAVGEKLFVSSEYVEAQKS
jgi:ribosomal protein L24